MNYTQRIKVKNIFLNEGCGQLNFEDCNALWQKYKEAINAPGCSACAKRRARSKYSAIVQKKIIDLDYDTVMINEK